MSATKYKKFYELMTEQNTELFDKFQDIHDKFASGDKSVEAKFHELGLEVVDIMRFWERKLCSGMERGKNSVYSDKLADKFWGEIRKRFSHIDVVGVKSK